MQQTSPIYHPAVMSELTSGFIKVVLSSFDSKNFWRQKHQLYTNKFFQTFFLQIMVCNGVKIQNRSTLSLRTQPNGP